MDILAHTNLFVSLFEILLYSLIIIVAFDRFAKLTHDQYYKNANKFWQNQGLKALEGTTASNIYERVTNERYAREKLDLGKVYGAYNGSKPVLVVADFNVMRQLCIKDFNTFSNRSKSKHVFSLESKFLHNMQDEQWRRVRSIWSAAFTCGKVRRMHRLIESCAHDMLEIIDKRLGSKPIVDLKHLFNLYTMDSVATCCYSLRMSQNQANATGRTNPKLDEFVKLVLSMFELKFWQKLLTACSHNSVLETFNIGSFSNFASIVQKIIKRRRKSAKRSDDFLQTLIDAEFNDNVTAETAFSLEGNDFDVKLKSETRSFKEGLLNESEILASAMLLFRLGSETISILLTQCILNLSCHQDIQENLYQKIKTLAKYDAFNRATFDYDSLTACKYLDAVISETLRKHPPIFATDRYANEDYYLASHKLHVPKGSTILFDLEAIMNDPDNWPNPEIFDPKRFMPENQHKIEPYSYCPFGVGPRHCLGMRFSLNEAKIALSKLLLEFRFELAPKMEHPTHRKRSSALNDLKRPEVMVIKR